MLIDLFINAGWYTVPLKGKLERLPNGKKTTPNFETNWKLKYSKEFNKEQSPLAAALTGKQSGIIALDCDNDLTYSMFKAMDPDYKFHFISEGKPEGGGTIIYRYTDKVSTFKLKTDTIALDFFSEGGSIYLPTEENYTKQSWEDKGELPELHECPPVILAMLETFKAKQAIPEIKQVEIKHVISNRLAPILETFVKLKKYEPALFKIITPYSFRDLPIYITKGHLHPNDIPKGRGMEYLSKVSAILGSDISVNIELYTNSMLLINSLWQGQDRPKGKDELMSTIINPMIEGKASIDGETIWKYDPHWEKMGFIATTLNGDYIESFYDDIKGIYYLINYTVPYVRAFSDKRALITTLKTLLGRTISEQQYDGAKQLVRTILNPSLEFGHIANSDKYNLFRQTLELAVLNNPHVYTSQYKRPNTIIKYFETLIPDDYMRNYILSFMKTKLTTFKYSPIILYLIGKPGSGKDTMVNIFRKIICNDYTSKPDTRVFLEQYNGWMLDKYLIQLDEYGNKLTKVSERQEVLGKLKAYTGSSEIQIRSMRMDGYNYKHCSTFILTANSNPLPLEMEDRRVAYAKTPNILSKADWVRDAGGIANVVEKLIPAEIMDFCYYLGTEVKTLTSDSYVIAPETEDKERLILDSLPAVETIVFYIQKNRWEDLVALSIELGISDFCKDWDKGRLLDTKLAELYSAMTEGHGIHRSLIRKLKEIGISRLHTTKGGANAFYYYINDLNRHVPPDYNEHFGLSAKHSGIKGLD
jgi:hypothetical protein